VGNPDHGLIIDLTGIEQVPVRFDPVPHMTAIVLGTGAVARPDLGCPAGLRSAVRRCMSSRSVEIFHILSHPGTYIWEGLVPTGDSTGGRWQPRFDNIDTNVSEFCADLTACYETPPAHWRAAMAKPWSFLCDYVQACKEAWAAVRPVLSDAAWLLDREAERVGQAAVRGTVPELLVSLYPGATLEGRQLRLPARRAKRLHLGQQGLTLGPVLAAAGRGGHSFVGDQVARLAYPLPGMDRLFDGAHPLAPYATDALAALLGPPRAALLRHIDLPVPVGQLADALQAVPSAVTYHVDALVAAGLVQRQRRGRQVLIVRTRRGERLLDLYS
jgi:hypothetical protein